MVKSQLWTWQITELFSGTNRRPIKKEEFYFLWNIYITQEMVLGMSRGMRVVILKENLSMYLSGDFFYRELDISVFTILHTGLITKSSLDTELNTKVGFYNCMNDISIKQLVHSYTISLRNVT